MRKYMVIAAAVLVAVFASGNNDVRAAHGVPEMYFSEYSATNFYSFDGILSYHFSDLQAGTEYSWLLQGVNSDGSVGQAFTWKPHTGSTSVTVTWEGSEGDLDTIDGTLYAGALRVIDNFGRVVGKHYTLPGCNLILSVACKNTGIDWIVNGTAVNLETQRFGIGDHRFPLQPLNSDNYFHPTETHSIVTTTFGDVTYLHYRLFGAALNDQIRLYDMAAGTLAYTFQVSDLIDYQVDDRNSVLTPQYTEDSFVVLNTSGGVLPYIYKRENDTAFENAGSLDNPHETILFHGAYDYTLTNNLGTWIADGESVALVTEGGAVEWDVNVGQSNVAEAGFVSVELETASQRIYTSGYIDHLLSDSVEGVIDTANYAFQTRRHSAYQVSGVAAEDVETVWSISPIILNQELAGLGQRSFSVSATYDILGAAAISELDVGSRIENTLTGFGMDTPLGRGLGMLLIMGVVMLAVAKRGGRSIIPFGLVYLAVGGGWLALGLGDTITTVLFGITAIFVIFIMVTSRKSETGGA